MNALNNNLLLSLLKVTESAAVSAYSLIGKGEKNNADFLAVEKMRSSLNNIDMQGTIVIGEGERDKAPMLYIGEKLGNGNGKKLDIAVDPLEGTNILANAGPDSLSVISIAEYRGFLSAPDVYMEKIAIGFEYPEQIIDLNNTPLQNLKNIAKAKLCNISDLMVCVLDRSKNKELIAKIREAGARVCLIQDGDIAAIIKISLDKGSGFLDVYMGIGGAPEGVLAAAAMKTIGGQICSKLLFDTDEQKSRGERMGIKDFNKHYYLNDLVKNDAIFIATGITDGNILNGIKIKNKSIFTYSVAMNSSTKTIKWITTQNLA